MERSAGRSYGQLVDKSHWGAPQREPGQFTRPPAPAMRAGLEGRKERQLRTSLTVSMYEQTEKKCRCNQRSSNSLCPDATKRSLAVMSEASKRPLIRYLNMNLSRGQRGAPSTPLTTPNDPHTNKGPSPYPGERRGQRFVNISFGWEKVRK